MTFDDRLGSIDETEAMELATKITLEEFLEEMLEVFEEIDEEATTAFDRVAVWGRAVTLRGMNESELDEDIESLFNRVDNVVGAAGNVQLVIQGIQEKLP